MTGDHVLLVPHTHWDREWYEPFQRFRLRLVELLDDVVARAESEPGFRFTLDGQTAAVDDYLEVRPEAEPRVAALVRAGRLAVGPWRVLQDEFLCSGETIVRNLELGWHRASALGRAMAVGYLPDQFGHCAQMPQILSRAGLRHACVWRGVPAEVGTHAFRWCAPDGSAVRAEYLAHGYGNVADLFTGPDSLVERARHRFADLAPWFPDAPTLAMYGTDHAAPLPTLMDLVGALDAEASLPPVRVATLADYVEARDADEPQLPVVHGELRSHASANLLPGVLSARRHLKTAMAGAERMVQRAESLAALWWPAGDDERTVQGRAGLDRYLAMAWARIVDSSCHDSVTGCGVDETALQVAARLAEAEQLGQAVRDQVTARLAAGVPHGEVLVVNPSPQPRSGLVTVEVVTPARWAGVALALPDGIRLGTQPAGPSAGAAAATSTGAAADGTRRHRLHAVVPVPAFGLTALRAVEGPASVADPVTVVDRGGPTLATSLLQVTVETAGTLRLTAADGCTLEGVGRLVDGGDRGDTYNYAPPERDALVDVPESVAVVVHERGPVRAVVEVRRDYVWPASLDADRTGRCGAVPVPTTTWVELRTGEPFVRLRLEVDNRVRDHRLRLHVPLAAPARTSYAEGQLAVVARSGTPQGGRSGERPVPTYPAYGFVDAGGAGVLLDGATEHELVGGRELALTLVRAVGWLSRDDNPWRREPAGPQLPTPDAQCLGVVRAALAVLPHRGGWEEADLVGAAEFFGHELVARPGSGAGDGSERPVQGVRVEGRGVVLSCLRRRGGWLELRLAAERTTPVTARLSGGVVQARRADLLGRPAAALACAGGAVELPLGPWEIATVQLRR